MDFLTFLGPFLKNLILPAEGRKKKTKKEKKENLDQFLTQERQNLDQCWTL